MKNDLIRVTGSHGRLGSTILRYLDPVEEKIVATDKNEVDITKSKEVRDFVTLMRPDIIINCSGLSKRQECEEDPDKAFLLNGIGAKNIAIQSSLVQAKLIQLSTADVFDGNTIYPYKEIDAPNPNTVYGKSKYLGENFVRQFSRRYFIVRVSRLYSKENGLVEGILKEAKEGVVKVPLSQYASPTPALELSKFLIDLMRTNNYGTYHASCKGYCSMKKFAQEISENAGLSPEIKEVKDLSRIDYSPSFRGIENYYLNITGQNNFESRQEALKDYMEREELI